MSPKEYQGLTRDFITKLTERVKERDGIVKFKQQSKDTWFISIDSGFIGDKAQMFEYFNNGEQASWRYRGLV